MKSHEPLQNLQGNWRNVLHGRRLPFKLGVIATLAIAIGANIAVLGNLGVLFGQVVPGASHQNLYQPYYTTPAVGQAAFMMLGVPQLMYRHFSEALAGKAETALYQKRSGNLAVLGKQATSKLGYLAVTPSFASVLGVQPVAGRTFTPSDAKSYAAPVAMIGAQVARRRFGGARAAIGKFIGLDGKSRQIIGVLPDALVFPSASPASAWVPFPPVPATSATGLNIAFDTEALVRPIGRLRPVEITAALQGALEQSLPGMQPKLRAFMATVHLTPRVSTLAHAEFEQVTPQLTMLELVAVIVLILVLANLAALTISDALARRHELATRVAMGAQPWRVYTERVREFLPLTVAGWAIGIGLGWGGSHALSAIVGSAGVPMTLSPEVLLLTLAAVAAISMLLATIGSFRFRSGAHVVTDLGAGRLATGGRRTTLGLRLLVIVQLAASLTLLLTTAQLLGNVHRLQHADFGFQPQQRVFFGVAHGGAAPGGETDASFTATQKKRQSFIDNVLRRLNAIPGIEAAAALTSVPLSGSLTTMNVAASPQAKPGFFNVQALSARAPEALGLHGLAGNVNATFAPDSEAVFVDRVAARRLWPHAAIGSDIGKTVYFDKQTSQVAAVVSDLQMFAYQPASGTVFMPVGSTEASSIVPAMFVVHSRMAPNVVRAAVAASLKRLDPQARITDYASANQIVAQAFATRNHLTQVFATVALVTLLIASVGLFALLAYRTLARRPELAIRSVLGAKPSRLFRHVLGEAAILWIVGCVIGLPLAYALSVELAHRLPAYGSLTAWIAILVSIGLGVIVEIAALTPALWSSRTAPAVVLRQS